MSRTTVNRKPGKVGSAFPSDQPRARCLKPKRRFKPSVVAAEARRAVSRQCMPHQWLELPDGSFIAHLANGKSYTVNPARFGLAWFVSRLDTLNPNRNEYLRDFATLADCRAYIGIASKTELEHAR